MKTIVRTALSLAAVLSFAATLAAPSRAAASNAAPVLAEAEGDQPGMRVEIRELKRSSGNTVTLKFTLRGESDIRLAYDMGQTEMSGIDLNTVGGVHLIDPVAKKKYLVIRDSSTKHCVCSRNVKPGKVLNLWAKFPAPPADVETIQVMIPGFAPMDDVPLAR